MTTDALVRTDAPTSVGQGRRRAGRAAADGVSRLDCPQWMLSPSGRGPRPVGQQQHARAGLLDIGPGEADRLGEDLEQTLTRVRARGHREQGEPALVEEVLAEEVLDERRAAVDADVSAGLLLELGDLGGQFLILPGRADGVPIALSGVSTSGRAVADREQWRRSSRSAYIFQFSPNAPIHAISRHPTSRSRHRMSPPARILRPP